MEKFNIFTWHVHGNYLYYLSHIRHNIFLPVNKDRTGFYQGKGKGFIWGPNIFEIDINEIKKIKIDCILFQHSENYLLDQYKILNENQRKKPKIFLEHDPPQEHPTNSKHIVNDPDITLVHVTYFNNLMWDCGETTACVIPHGVIMPSDAFYSGVIKKGLVIVNNLKKRGRRLGLDIFKYVRKNVPLDLIGIGSKELGGLGEISHKDFPYFIGRYRFIFNPIRYTSLGLSICEAMTIGLPIVALGTTEQASILKNNFNGYIGTNIDFLIERMNELIENPIKALELGDNARRYAINNFNINNFILNWENIFGKVIKSGYQNEHVNNLVNSR